MRHTKKILSELTYRINKGHSINRISREMKLAKSTIYYYYKKIKGRKYKVLSLTPGFSRVEGEIVGIFAGDGSLYYDKRNYGYDVRIHFGNKNLDYGIYVKNLFESYFRKKFNMKANGETTFVVYTRSKAIYHFFSHYLDFIPSTKHNTVKFKNRKYPRCFKIGFLEGFIDTDGYLKFKEKENRIRITMYTTSKKLSLQIVQFLKDLGMGCTYMVYKKPGFKDVYRIQLLQAGVKRFLSIAYPFKATKLKG